MSKSACPSFDFSKYAAAPSCMSLASFFWASPKTARQSVSKVPFKFIVSLVSVGRSKTGRIGKGKSYEGETSKSMKAAAMAVDEADCWRKIPWLLKNSCFVKIAEIWEIENVCQNGDRRL
jgi:hypothetical protein